MVMGKVVPYNLSIDGSNVCSTPGPGFLSALPPGLVSSDIFARETISISQEHHCATARLVFFYQDIWKTEYLPFNYFLFTKKL